MLLYLCWLCNDWYKWGFWPQHVCGLGLGWGPFWETGKVCLNLEPKLLNQLCWVYDEQINVLTLCFLFGRSHHMACHGYSKMDQGGEDWRLGDRESILLVGHTVIGKYPKVSVLQGFEWVGIGFALRKWLVLPEAEHSRSGFCLWALVWSSRSKP